jgi:hypothetical protein
MITILGIIGLGLSSGLLSSNFKLSVPSWDVFNFGPSVSATCTCLCHSLCLVSISAFSFFIFCFSSFVGSLSFHLLTTQSYSGSYSDVLVLSHSNSPVL